uniref:GSL8 n=1 Tax=Arundo donax TaxID=35708 RepID=A0A0A9EQ90_ARUDO
MMEKLYILLGGIMMTSMNISGHVHALILVGHLLRVPSLCASQLRGSVQERPTLLSIALFCTCTAVFIACGFFYY